MEVPNAFLGKTEQPSDKEVAAALGPAAAPWTEFVAWMAEKHGIAQQEWKGIYVDKYGWMLRLMRKKKIVVYLSPCEGCFRVAFTLNDKAVQAAREARFPKDVAKAIAEAPHYPEGTGLRLLVRSASDLPSIQKLAAIKLAN
jgi:hypothetical protein